MNSVVKEEHLVLKIRLGSGAFKSRLLQALERLGGPYRVLKGPASSGRSPSGGAYSGRRFAQPASEAAEWIRYGPEEADWGGPVQEIVLGRPKGSLENWRRRLEAAGLKPTTLERSADAVRTAVPSYTRRFAVTVFHLRAWEIRPLSQAGQTLPLRSEPLSPDSPLHKRLTSTAIRALYAVGLDFGEVVISAGEEGRFTVDAVTPASDFGSAAVPGFARAMRETLEEQEKLRESAAERLIGMDPEFLLFDSTHGKVVPASRYLQFHGEAGCDVLRYRGQRLFPLAELRPRPGKEPRDVIVHLLHAFREARASIEDRGLIWQAGAMPQCGFPLGGHLHFSGIALTPELLRTLDNYLALPLAVLEDPRSAPRRPKYGFLGDFRIKEYGGFEYRTLPSFLVSPLVTKGVVALACLIIENADRLHARPLERDVVWTAFYTGRKQPLREEVSRLLADIQGVPDYSRYRGYVAPLLEAIQSGRAWDESADIRSAWKLQNPS
ncbi:MAG: hypothetical protein E6Y08_16630 [Paenibacillus sp.]|uniref:putative amidoligase domain-containing protein n=1 Tax=Paenibacillus sp. TaxID=58172 RepID=UPI0029109ED5|nr:hypothetical protein [Paenibacillus sp.]MDU4697437.1 hypothetical protein [Paenibacillus sp.]